MAGFLCSIINLYILIVFVRVLLSWFPASRTGPFAMVHRAVHLVTEPILGPLRRVLPLVRLGGAALDLAPLVVFGAALVLTRILCTG